MRIPVELTAPVEFQISMTPRMRLLVLVRTICFPALRRPHGMQSDTLAEAIGLAHWIAPGSLDLDVSRRARKARTILDPRSRHEREVAAARHV